MRVKIMTYEEAYSIDCGANSGFPLWGRKMTVAYKFEKYGMEKYKFVENVMGINSISCIYCKAIIVSSMEIE